MNGRAVIGRSLAIAAAALLAAGLPQPVMANPTDAGASTTIEDPVGSVVLDQPLQLLTTSFNLMLIGPNSTAASLTTFSSSDEKDGKKKQGLAQSDLPQQSVSGYYSQNDSDDLKNPVFYRQSDSVMFKRISLILLQFN